MSERPDGRESEPGPSGRESGRERVDSSSGPAEGQERGARPDPVRITFLGGLGEIGRNCACIEVAGRILLLDVGLMFPELDMLGVDLVLPDFTYLRENADRVDGAVITHGHEDHMGGLGYLLREMSFPIYGSELTLGLARS
jgi:ribonuclease J